MVPKIKGLFKVRTTKAFENVLEFTFLNGLPFLCFSSTYRGSQHIPVAQVKRSRAAKVSTKSKRSKKRAVDTSETSDADDIWKCQACGFTFGAAEDPKITDDWLSCIGCGHKYHESCAEDNGVVDDDSQLTCRLCLD